MGIFAMTGGATGIGAATKEQLRGEGHEVIVVDITNADIEADLSTDEGRQRAIDGICAAAPQGLDGFVPCAGLGPSVSPSSLITRVNYFGAVAVTEGVKHLVAQRGGAMVLISSNSAPMGADREYVDLLLAGEEKSACERIDTLDAQNAYAGSKLALTRWMRRHTVAYAKAGIRINAVAPGITKTPLTDRVYQDPTYGQTMKEFGESVPLGAIGRPEQIAEVICFLLSAKASFVAGSVFFVDGGHDAMLRPDEF